MSRPVEEKDLETERGVDSADRSPRPHFHTTNAKLAGKEEGRKEGRKTMFSALPPSLPLFLLFAFFFLFRLSEAKEGKAKRVNLRELRNASLIPVR